MRRFAWLSAGSLRTLVRLRWLVPLLFGAWSASLGVDANWELYNYHLYNPFAFLHGKLAIDLPPAGLQTYFNPLLDVPYYLASRSFPAPVVAFAMGTIHGLNFVLLLAIARRVVAALPDWDGIGIPLALSAPLGGGVATSARARRRSDAGDRALSCRLALRPGNGKNVAAEDQREQAKAQAILSAYGLSLKADSCRSYRAGVGSGVSVYQWCRVGE